MSRQLAEGWSVSGITRFASGFPVTMINNGDNSLIGTNPNGVNNSSIDEPDYNGGPLHLNRNPRTNGNNYFDASDFSMNALGTPGNARRRFFFGPGANNYDMALAKSLTLGDSKSLLFRVEGVQRFQSHAVQRPRRDRRQYRQFDIRKRDQRCPSAHSAGSHQVQFLIMKKKCQ